ncbi:PX domain-containing protein EREL1 isoform X3 [Elaeis guineensis]|uniref:PX domain-containing protein EREL1 isoform X2 n=1 Tax=Elaeis guineensis var. tenera TaxID=51953 RepID=A0A6I9QU08_ELAGV|nr:PX domain-containing protein EREL1 isoform X2 [Elaeis guineensis]
MFKNSPPKHRHDGTSPLPLGMDWSPPPKKWDGRNTIWPHNPHTGWSYCVMIPSWIVQTDPGASHDSFLNPIVFYRIHIGIQSPEGVSTSHGVLRRFSDFLKLYSALKKAFPKKDIPPAPPKHAFLRINSSRMLLEERRHDLEEWMGKLLCDIDLSRSAPVASFLELEAAARSSFRDVNHDPLETSSSGDAIAMASSIPLRPSSSASIADGAKVASKSHSVASDIDSDVCEASDLGTPRQGKVQISSTSTENLAMTHDLTVPRGSIGNGIMGESILDKSEEFLTSSLHCKRENLVLETDSSGGISKETFLSRGRLESTSEWDHDKFYGHTRKLSAESTGSDISSIRGSELSFPGMTNSIWDGSVDLPSSSEAQNAMEALSGLETHILNDAQIFLPLDQRYKLNRVLVTMQRRLGTVKADMEDLIARLHQAMAVNEYLTTKVKDLEVELEVTKQKGKENLQQAILVERERVTQMQWDMDELHRKYLEIESRLKIEQNEKTRAESEKTTAHGEKELLLQELDAKQEVLGTMQKHLEELEKKSKADIKVLVKEVKFLRSSQVELKEMLNQSLREKTELERVVHKEKQRWIHAESARKKLLNECRVLHDRLQECRVNFLSESEDKFSINPSSLSDALDLLATSDDRIGLLLAEAQLLARDEEQMVSDMDEARSSGSSENLIATNDENPINADDEIRKMLTDLFIDNARLRKQVNSVIRCTLNTVVKPEKEDSDEVPSRWTVLNRFLER